MRKRRRAAMGDLGELIAFINSKYSHTLGKVPPRDAVKKYKPLKIKAYRAAISYAGRQARTRRE